MTLHTNRDTLSPKGSIAIVAGLQVKPIPNHWLYNFLLQVDKQWAKV